MTKRSRAASLTQHAHLFPADVVGEQAVLQDNRSATANHHRTAFSLRIVLEKFAGGAVFDGAAVKLYPRWAGRAREYDCASLPLNKRIRPGKIVFCHRIDAIAPHAGTKNALSGANRVSGQRNSRLAFLVVLRRLYRLQVTLRSLCSSLLKAWHSNLRYLLCDTVHGKVSVVDPASPPPIERPSATREGHGAPLADRILCKLGGGMQSKEFRKRG